MAVGLQDMHPPVKVAPDFEKVIAAIHTKAAKILAAEADDIESPRKPRRRRPTCSTKPAPRRPLAGSARWPRRAVYHQIPAFEAAPSVYAERAYLQTFVRATADARKYLLLTTNTHDVLTFDLQESFTRDLSRLSVPAPKT